MIAAILLGLVIHAIGMGITVLALEYDVVEAESSDFESFSLIDDYADNGAFILCLLWPLTLWFLVLHIIFIKVLKFVERNSKR